MHARISLTLIVLTACLLRSPLAAQDTRPLIPATSPGVLRIDGVLVVLELSGRAAVFGYQSLASHPLELPETRGASETRSVLVWQTYVPYERWGEDPGAPLSSARRADGAWVLASSYYKGGGRGLHYWSGLSDPRDHVPSDEVRARTIHSLALVETDAVVVETERVPSHALVENVSDPQVLERNGRFYVVTTGSAQDMTRHESGWLIMASPLPIRDDHLELSGGKRKRTETRRLPPSLVARLVSHGADPRVAQLRDLDVLAVRRAWFRALGPAPLRFSTTTDFKTWTIDENLSAGITAEPAYAIAARNGAIWMASTRSEADRCSIVLHRFASDSSTWVVEKTFDAGPRIHHAFLPVPYIWLFSAEDEPGPVVVFRNQKGELKVFR